VNYENKVDYIEDYCLCDSKVDQEIILKHETGLKITQMDI